MNIQPTQFLNFSSSKPNSNPKPIKMNKLIAITFAALVGLVLVVAVAQASGYGYGAPSYGQNYERKTGFKTVSIP